MKNKLSFAYIAGLFDAEGTVSVWCRQVKSTEIYTTKASIAQKNPLILRRIKKYLGFGYLYHDKHSNAWTLNFSDNQTLQLFCNIQKYSLIKKRQIDLVIKFQKTKRRNNLRLVLTNKQRNFYRFIYKNLFTLKSKHSRFSNVYWTQNRLRWLAGFFDGDGCVGIYTYNRKNQKKTLYVMKVNLTQKYPEILYLIQNKFRGAVTTYKSGNALVSKLHLSRNVALRFLHAIQSYVFIKRRQIDHAINFQINTIGIDNKTLKASEHAKHYKAYLKSKKLNKAA